MSSSITYHMEVNNNESSNPHDEQGRLKQSFIEFILEQELSSRQSTLTFPLFDGIILKPCLKHQVTLKRLLFKKP